jgi:type IV pilus assembly protein PilO
MEKFLVNLSGLTLQKVMFFGVLAAAVYYFTSFNDGSKLRAEIQSQKTKLQQEIDLEVESRRAIKQEQEVIKELAELNDQFKLASQQLPSKVEPAEMSRDIDEASVTSGLAIKQKTPGAQRPSKLDVVKELPVALEATGNFSEVARFLYQLGTMNRIIRVKDFSMVNIDPNKPGKLVFRGEVVSYLFHAVDPAEPKK